MRRSRRNRRRQTDAEWLKWALISLALGAIVFFGWRAFVMHQVTQMFNDIASNSQAISQRILQQEKDRQAQLARERELKAQQTAQALAAQRQAQEELAARAARKEAAWNQFFKPSKKCLDDPITVDCANAHIRARKQFEATYQDTP